MSYVSLYVRKEVSCTTFSENLISSSTPLLFFSFCCCICYEVWGPMNWYCQRGLRSTPWEVDLSSETCSDKLEKTVRDLQKCSDVCGLIGTKVHRLEGESVVLVSFKFVCEMWVCVCTSVDLLCLCLKRERENSYEVCCLAFVQGHRHWRWREHSDTYSKTSRRLVLQRELCGDVLEYLFFGTPTQRR